MKELKIKFTDSDWRLVCKAAFNANQSEEDWIYDQIQAILLDME